MEVLTGSRQNVGVDLVQLLKDLLATVGVGILGHLLLGSTLSVSTVLGFFGVHALNHLL